MNLYLVRHGEALPKEEDTRRPLSAVGAETVRRVGEFLAGTRLADVGALYFSTKLRARQTAETLADAAGLQATATEVPNLEPLADVEETVRMLREVREDDLMLVGHLPQLSRLASRLVTGDAELDAFSFPAGGVLCLRRADEASEPAWRVSWFLVPELLESGTGGSD